MTILLLSKYHLHADCQYPMSCPVSSESEVLRKHYGALYDTIHNADWLTIALYSEGLISRSARQDIEETLKQNNKNTKLLAAVERVITIDPDKFEYFLNVLDREEYLQSLVEKMRVDLCK